MTSTHGPAVTPSEGQAPLGQRLLVIDDNDWNVKLLYRVLRSGGYQHIDSCLDSRKAIETIIAWRPDLILLDLNMPHLDGYQVLKRIQAITPSTEFLPVIVLTADATPQSRNRMLGAAAHDYLTKPFDSTEVLLRVRNLLLTRSLQRSVTELLEQTLTGAVEALLEVLSLANPLAFNRGSRIAGIVNELLDAIRPPNAWTIKIAAGISQIGAVTLSPNVATKLDAGRSLTRPEQDQVDRLPIIAAGIVEHIPQLEGVGAIIRAEKRVQGFPSPELTSADFDTRIGASLLRIAIDIDQLEAQCISRLAALDIMRSRAGEYDPELLDVVEQLARQTQPVLTKIETTLDNLTIGMVVAHDLCDTDGVLLISHGQTITARILELLHNRRERVQHAIYVYVAT